MVLIAGSFAMSYGTNEGMDGDMGGGREHMAAPHLACLDPVILLPKALVWGKGLGTIKEEARGNGPPCICERYNRDGRAQ